MQDFSKQISFTFFEGWSPGKNEVLTGRAFPLGNREHLARNPAERRVRMELSYKALLPLLGKLTQSERLTQNFLIANTIAHELCVSLDMDNN